jgi:ribosomal protein S18 acetylase RimI-like enzyme
MKVNNILNQINIFEHFTINFFDSEVKQEIKHCIIRKCTENDYDSIIDIQDIIINELKNSNNLFLFIPTDNDEIKVALKDENYFFICAQTSEGICAYSCTTFMNNFDIGLFDIFINKKIAIFDTVVVAPQYRGNKLQSKLIYISENEARNKGFDILVTTVSPNNIQSFNNFIENNFRILVLTCYKNLDRYLLYKHLL